MTFFSLLQRILQQSWQVALLALLVWLLTRYVFRKRAHLSHMLWALVLIKCMTPPIWSSPVGFFSRVTGSWNVGSTSQLVNQSNVSNGQVNDWSNATILFGVEPGSRSPSAGAIEKTMAGNEAASTTLLGAIAVLWIGGFCVMTMLSVVRWLMFLRELRRAKCETPPEVSRCVEELQKRLGIRRKIGVLVVTSSLGPAVYGLLRPVVLLPQKIIAGMTAEQQRLLIAHEMIHIRRGDLWLALVQSIACNLGWFHPAVWLASRQLTIESERCCDEETIASLPCKPAAYARSLLEVLEWKHQLRVAPALPGVRPMDITRARLERIMRLGQGSRRRSPWWVWCIALLGGVVLLPGGKYVTAQTPDAKRSTNHESKSAPLPLPPVDVSQPPNQSVLTPVLKSEQNSSDNPNIIVQAQVIEIGSKLPEALPLQRWMNESKSGAEVKLAKAEIEVQADASATPTNFSFGPIVTSSIERLFSDSQTVKVAADSQTKFSYFGTSSISLKHPNRLRVASLSSEEHKTFLESIVEPCQPHLVVQRPTLIVHSGKQATISFDKNVPIQADTSEGFTLKILPTLFGEKKIRLEYEMTKTEKSPSSVGIHKRAVNAEIECKLSETLVVASKMGTDEEPYDLVIIRCALFELVSDK